MTMVPAENLAKQHHIQPHHLPHGGCGGGGGFYGGCGGNYKETSTSSSFGLMNRVQVQGYDYQSEACLGGGSDLGSANIINPMAEDESRTNSLNEAGSSSKDNINNNQEAEIIRDHEEEEEEGAGAATAGWLQLGLAGQTTNKHDDQVDPIMARRERLIELDLLPTAGGSSQPVRPLAAAPIFHMVPEFRAHHHHHPPRPPPVMHSFSTSLFFQHHHHHQQAAAAAAGGSSSSFPHGEIS